MHLPNQLRAVLGKLDALPSGLRQVIQTFLLGRMVPFVGTTGQLVEEVSRHRVAVGIKNRRSVQGHLRGVHAAVIALLAETASGFAVGLNMPEGKIPLLKELHVHYFSRAQGNMRAVVELGPEQVDAIRLQERGELKFSVPVLDQDGQAPARCELTWAWVTRKMQSELSRTHRTRSCFPTRILFAPKSGDGSIPP